MLADAERYLKTPNGEFVFQIKVCERGFEAALLLVDGSFEIFASSSSVSTFLDVMATIINAVQPVDAKKIAFALL